MPKPKYSPPPQLSNTAERSESKGDVGYSRPGVSGVQWKNQGPQGAPADTKRVAIGNTRPQRRSK